MKTKVWKIIALLAIAVFAISTAKLVSGTSTLSPTSTVSSVSGAMAYDSGTGAIYVLGLDGSMKVLSDTTNTVITTIDTGITYGAAQQLVYGQGKIFASSGVATAEGETPAVTVISDSTNTVAATITNSHWWVPMGMAYDSGTGNLYLADRGNLGNVLGAVYVIDDTNTVTGSIQVGAYPEELVYDSGMHEIFVANAGSGNVSVISDSNNQVVATIAVGTYPYGIAYDSKMNEVFVYNEGGDNTVSVISDSSNTVVKTITGITGNNVNPTNIAYNPNKNEIFAGYSVISDSTNTVVAQLPTTVTDMIYDSGRGEILGASSIGMAVFADSSSTSTSPTSNASSPTPIVPEFSNVTLISVAAAMAVVTLGAVALTKRTRKQLLK